MYKTLIFANNNNNNNTLLNKMKKSMSTILDGIILQSLRF